MVAVKVRYFDGTEKTFTGKTEEEARKKAETDKKFKEALLVICKR